MTFLVLVPLVLVVKEMIKILKLHFRLKSAHVLRDYWLVMKSREVDFFMQQMFKKLPKCFCTLPDLPEVSVSHGEPVQVLVPAHVPSPGYLHRYSH